MEMIELLLSKGARIMENSAVCVVRFYVWVQ